MQLFQDSSAFTLATPIEKARTIIPSNDQTLNTPLTPANSDLIEPPKSKTTTDPFIRITDEWAPKLLVGGLVAGGAAILGSAALTFVATSFLFVPSLTWLSIKLSEAAFVTLTTGVIGSAAVLGISFLGIVASAFRFNRSVNNQSSAN